jgi:hypothetical protein
MEPNRRDARGFGSAVEYFQADPNSLSFLFAAGGLPRRGSIPRLGKVALILIFAKQLHALAVRVPASTIPT